MADVLNSDIVNDMSRKLEGYRIFSLVAVLAIAGFVFFIYTLAQGLQEQNGNLGERTNYIENAVDDPSNI